MNKIVWAKIDLHCVPMTFIESDMFVRLETTPKITWVRKSNIGRPQSKQCNQWKWAHLMKSRKMLSGIDGISNVNTCPLHISIEIYSWLNVSLVHFPSSTRPIVCVETTRRILFNIENSNVFPVVVAFNDLFSMMSVSANCRWYCSHDIQLLYTNSSSIFSSLPFSPRKNNMELDMQNTDFP